MDYKASLDSAAQINTLVAIILFIFTWLLEYKKPFWLHKVM